MGYLLNPFTGELDYYAAASTGAEIVTLLEALASGSRLSHDDGLSDVSADDHHAQSHGLDSEYHTVSGLSTGHFLKATGATSFAFTAHGLTYSDVGAEVSGAVTSHESTYNHGNYNTAYDWGNHAGLYDPAGTMTTHQSTYNHGNYDTAYNWGDHTGVYELVGISVLESDYGAQTILRATANSTPTTLTVTEQTLIGRITSGNIAALSTTQIRTLINVADGADVTANSAPQAHVLISASHTASGLTTGHFLKATGATTFGFGAHGLTYSDVGAEQSGVSVLEADYGAQTILQATTNNTPTALTVDEQRLVGRITSGNITALTAAQVLTLIGVESGATADQTGIEIVSLLEALAGAAKLSHDSGLSDVSSDDHHNESHNAASHSDLTSSGATIEAAVSASHSNASDHTQGTDTTLGTMTADIDMNGSYQVVGLQAPDASGQAIRATAKITEAKMEAADDHVAAANPHSGHALESVLGTSIGTGLLLTTTVLSVSSVLQTYHGINPSSDVQSLLGCANEAAIRTFLDLEPGTDFYSTSTLDTALGLKANLAGPTFTGTVTVPSTNFTVGTQVLTQTNLTDLLDGGDTTLHDHDGITENTNARHVAITLNVSATTGGLGLTTQEITFRAATNAQTGYATAAHITAIEANSDKVSCTFANVQTALGVANGAVAFNSQALTGVGAIGCGTITSTGNVVIANAGNVGSVGDTDAIAITAVGILTFSGQSGCHITLDTAHGLNAGVERVIKFDLEVTDVQSEYVAATGRFTAMESGTYLIHTSLLFEVAADLDVLRIRIKVNDTTVREHRCNASATFRATVLLGALVDLAATDYVEIWAENASNDDTITDTAECSWLTIAKVA